MLSKQPPGVQERLEQLIETLRKNDFRLTPQRYAILQILARSENHPSAENIHQELLEHHPSMSLATVYKTLNLLKKEGEVLELQFSEFGNRYDGNKPYSHPHVICTSCGIIIDPRPLDLEGLMAKMGEETGFSIESHRLDFYGICPECRKK